MSNHYGLPYQCILRLRIALGNGVADHLTEIIKKLSRGGLKNRSPFLLY